MIVIFILCGIFPVDSFISEDSVAIILQKCYNNSKCDGMETGSDIILLENKKYEIEYLPTFISQFNNILYYITYELKNKIAADNFYNEVVKQIEIRSEAPEAYEVFKTIKNGEVKYYKINVKNYTIFYVVKNNIMEIRRIYYSQRNFDNLI